MEKKNYIAPQMNVENMQTVSMIASSDTGGGFGGQTSSGSGAAKYTIPLDSSEPVLLY